MWAYKALKLFIKFEKDKGIELTNFTQLHTDEGTYSRATADAWFYIHVRFFGIRYGKLFFHLM